MLKNDPGGPVVVEVSQPPAILVGINGIGNVAVVGMYETADRAEQAVNTGEVPHEFNYSVLTPEMNTFEVNEEARKIL